MKYKYKLHFVISFLAHSFVIFILFVVSFYNLDNRKAKFTIENYNTIKVGLVTESSVKNTTPLHNKLKDNSFKAKVFTQKIKKDNLNKNSFLDNNIQKSLPIPILNNRNIINYIPPVYPQASLLLKEQGTVSVMLLINKKGKIIESKLDKSSGHTRLDNAVLETAKIWSVKNIPTQDSWVVVTVNFVIK